MHLPAFLHEPFGTAMAQSILLPAFVALFGVLAAIFLIGPVSRTTPQDSGIPSGPARS